MNDDPRRAVSEPGRRDRATMYRRPGGLVVLAAAALVGLAACSSGSSTNPGVASLGNSSGSSTATGSPTGSPTTLLNEWAACMRSHGDPNQADPTIDSNKAINITLPAGYSPPKQSGQQSSGKGPAAELVSACQKYLTAASAALRATSNAPKPSQATMLKFAKCMRANGIPDFPDPTGHNFAITPSSGSDMNPHNPTFQNAAKVCAKKAGVPQMGSGGVAAGGVNIHRAGSNGG